jgi:apolipoprotein D and lipocalin family protein
MKRAHCLAALIAATLPAGCVSEGRVPNARVPEPAQPVDLARYQGLWHELARFDASFQRGCEGVTAQYEPLADGTLRVLNTCRQDSPAGPSRSAEALARVVPGSANAKLKVSFFWPFEGDYWVLDRAADYSWAIVGEPSGQYLWILSRQPVASTAGYARLVSRVAAMGYNTAYLRKTVQPPSS